MNNIGMIHHLQTHERVAKSASASDAREGEDGAESEHKSKKMNIEDIVGCNLVNKETVVPSKDTWLIVVHHKTTVTKVSSHGDPMCYVFVSLVGMIHEVQLSS
jgi:hypothetical protein